MEPHEKLREAMLILSEVRKGLDLSETKCECCGLTKYTNYEHRKWDETLRGGIKKLRRLSDEMERKGFTATPSSR